MTNPFKSSEHDDLLETETKEIHPFSVGDGPSNEDHDEVIDR